MRGAISFLVIGFCLAAAGCSGRDNGSGDGARGDGHATGDGVSGDGLDGIGGDGSGDGSNVGDGNFGPDSVCASNTFDTQAVPPNVLILLDRSCSMRRTPSGQQTTAGSGLSKWSIAVAALQSLTTTYATQVRWGLIYLPRGGTMADGVMCGGTPVCGGTTVCPEVAPGPGTGPMVVSTLATISPFVHCADGTQVAITPLDDGIIASGMVSQLHDTARQDFVMLITDGEETCLGTPAVAAPRLAMDVMQLASMGIRTAVVGFGSTGGGGVNPQELNAMAMAGGIPASGANQYYAANDATSLQAAFTTIIGATLSCTFTLSAPSMNPSLLHVFVNGTTELPRDPTHMNGWDYDATTHTITLYGMPCDDVRHLRDSQLAVVESCPGGPPPPPPGMCSHNGQACNTNADCCNLEGLACDTVHHICIPAPG